METTSWEEPMETSWGERNVLFKPDPGTGSAGMDVQIQQADLCSLACVCPTSVRVGEPETADWLAERTAER